jgi:hypothetical protein
MLAEVLIATNAFIDERKHQMLKVRDNGFAHHLSLASAIDGWSWFVDIQPENSALTACLWKDVIEQDQCNNVTPNSSTTD